jgi:hypothetical protein
MDLSVEDMLLVLIVVQGTALVALLSGLSKLEKDVKAIRGSLHTLQMKASRDDQKRHPSPMYE